MIVTDKTRRQNWKENNQACRKAGCHQPSHHHSGLPNPFCSQSWLWVSLLWRPADCVTNTSLTWSRWGFFKTHVQWRGRSQLKWNQCGLLAWLRSKDLGSKIPWKAMQIHLLITLLFLINLQVFRGFWLCGPFLRHCHHLSGFWPLVASSNIFLSSYPSSLCPDTVLWIILAAGPTQCCSW